MRGTRTGTYSSAKNVPGNVSDESSRYLTDISIISAKIAELSGDASIPQNLSLAGNPSSPFVAGIRQAVDTSGKLDFDSKASAIDRVLSKVTELDRLVLKKTSPNALASFRRSSRGADLNSLPIHIQLVDRLLDLYAQSKRVTVVRTQTQDTADAMESKLNPLEIFGGGISPKHERLSSEKKLIESLQSTISTQLQEIDRVKGELSISTEKHEHVLHEVQELQRQLKDSSARPDFTQQLRSNQEEIQILREQLSTSQTTISYLRNNVEAEMNKYQLLLGGILSLTTAVRSNTLTLMLPHDERLPIDGTNGLKLLTEAILSNTDMLQSEINSLISGKDELERELSTLQLEREWLNKDMTSLNSELEVLKAAYHALETESIDARQRQKKASSGSEEKLNAATAVLEQLQSDLVVAVRRNLELEKLTTSHVDFEHRIKVIEGEKRELGANLNCMKEELSSYKKLTETLKQKIRDMSTADGREFLDSFEEVMREEMMTMKGAFEAKLRVAREEADATSRRHQQEIQRLHASSPYKR